MSFDKNHFIDLGPKNDYGFQISYEDPSLLREWTQDLSPKEICAISSGGESVLLGFLPLGVPVIGVDIAYNSIAFTYLKAKLIERYEAKELKKIMQTSAKLNRVLEEIMLEMPETLSKRIISQYSPPSDVALSSGSHDWDELWKQISHVWSKTPDWVIDASRKNLENLTLVHGNQADCKKFGKFEMVYSSNAIGYSSQAPLDNYALISLTKNNGHILSSCQLPKDILSILKLERTKNDDIPDGYSYFLYKKDNGLFGLLITEFLVGVRKIKKQSPFKYFFY